jgi:hypothetical protein
VDQESRLSGRQHLFDERRDVEHERHALVAQLGRSREAAHAFSDLPSGLMTMSCCPTSSSTTNPSRGRHLGDDHERARLWRAPRLMPNNRSSRQIGRDAPRTVRTSRDSMARRALRRARWPPRRSRAASRKAPADLDEKDVDDRQRDRQRDRHLGADADVARDVDDAAELGDVRLDDVEPHAAPAQVGRDFLRREPRHEDEREHLARRELLRLFGVTTPRRIAASTSTSGSMPAPSSSTSMTTWLPFWKALSAIVPMGACPREPLVARLDAVIDRVADHVHQRVGELFDDELVDLRLGARDDEVHLLAVLARDLPDDARQLVEGLAQRDHAHLEDAALHLRQVPVEGAV